MHDRSSHITLDQLKTYLDAPSENEHLEFKEARNHFDFEKLVKYCVALANEGGGKVILGVTDDRPRKVVGTQAFQNLERTKAGLFERLHLRIDAQELLHPKGRVLVFHIPPRPRGVPIEYKGAYWMRSGEDLVPMTPDMLRRIFDEATLDFSAEICPGASLADLDPDAIQEFRSRWIRKSNLTVFEHVDDAQLLTDAELIVDGGITYAALILFGTRKALGRHLAQAEVIFEYRSDEASVSAQQRKEYREGFFLYHDDLWNMINQRNDVYHYQDGFFVWDIPTFNESVVREAILNAVCHRDYRLEGSVFVRQFPNKLEIVSPGGFLPGITPENILWRQRPRNRRLADAFTKCGLVERSGQGVDRMFRENITEGKLPPDFSRSDEYQVELTLRGEVQDPSFVRFLERVGKETGASFTTEDLLLLDLIHREQPIPETLRYRLDRLRELGIVESQGRGRGTRYLLSRRFYAAIGQRGVYTRKRGLDREANKALLLKHIVDSGERGCPFSELSQVLPSLPRHAIQSLLADLKREGKIRVEGRTRGARWYPESSD